LLQGPADFIKKKTKNIYLAGDFMTAIWGACPDNGRYPKAAKPIKLLKMCYLALQFLIIIYMHLVTPLDKWLFSLVFDYQTFK